MTHLFSKPLLKTSLALLVFFLVSCHEYALPSFLTPMPAPEALHQQVTYALIQSNDPYIAGVHVASSQGLVILSGYVKKIRQSDMAEQLARQVPGVVQVQNNIIVRP